MSQPSIASSVSPDAVLPAAPLGRTPIRLNGVSAPEMNEPFGRQSKTYMTDLDTRIN